MNAFVCMVRRCVRVLFAPSSPTSFLRAVSSHLHFYLHGWIKFIYKPYDSQSKYIDRFICYICNPYIGIYYSYNNTLKSNYSIFKVMWHIVFVVNLKTIPSSDIPGSKQNKGAGKCPMTELKKRSFLHTDIKIT